MQKDGAHDVEAPNRNSEKTSMAEQSFTQRVHMVVKRIPRGGVLTYREVAARAGRPGASRAVGTILKKNFDPTIPCHRVIKSDGTLGAYNRGAEEKARKLRAEGYLRETRYDIVVYPPAPIRAQALAINKKLVAKGGLFSLGTKTCVPHITVYVARFGAAEMKGVQKTLKDLAARTPAFKASSTGYWNDGPWAHMRYKKDAALVRLRHAIIQAMQAHHPYDKNRFFVPHITLTKFEHLPPRVFDDLPSTDMSFTATHIGLFELGEYGTCKKQVAIFPLKGI